MSTNRHMRKHACKFCSDMLSCNPLPQMMKHGCTTMNLQANIKAWRGETSSSRTKKFKKVCLLPALWCWHCFGTLMGLSSSNTRIMDRWSIVQGIVLCLKMNETCCSQQTQRNADKWRCFPSWQCYSRSDIETIQKLKFKLLPHPAYNPDLTPFNYHIFGLLKDALQGCWFANDKVVKDAVHMWFHVQPKILFTDGIRKLMDQSNNVWRS